MDSQSRHRHLLDQLDHDDDNDGGDNINSGGGIALGDEEIDAHFEGVRSALEELKKWWQNERFAPELLPYRKRAVDAVKGQMLNRTVQLSMTHMEMKEKEKESDRNIQHGGGPVRGNGDSNLMRENEDGDHAQRMERIMIQQMIYQLECNRVGYILSSYLRTRQQKIEMHAQFALDEEQKMRESGPVLSDGQLITQLVSEEEKQFAVKLLQLEKLVYQRVLLDRVAEMRAEESVTQVESVKPDLTKFVFCKVMQSIGLVDMGGETVDLEEGDIYVIRYEIIRRFVLEGSISLI